MAHHPAQDHPCRQPIVRFLTDFAAEGPQHRNCKVNLDDLRQIVQI